MQKKALVLVLGGTRSGKSQFAEELAAKCGGKVLYIATANIYDEEMAIRVQKHKVRRPEHWLTIEEPKNVAKLIKESAEEYDAILLDCLTLWLSNLLLDPNTAQDYSPIELEDYLFKEIMELAEASYECRAKVIVVSSEVGLGVVPQSPLGRQFRDLAGHANQIFAKKASEVYFIAAGLPMTLKS